jgi:MATE family multidrug resistance protein
MPPVRPHLREARATLALAVPLALAQLAQMAMSFVDVVMIGRLGPAAMAGGVVGSSVFFSLAVLCFGTVAAVNPTVAQAVGAGDEEGIGRAARQGLWLATALGLPLFVLFGFAEPLLLAAGQAPGTAALAAGFLRAIRWGLLPNLWFTALRGLCEGIARPRPVLAVTLGAAVFNVGANYVLIYGKLGFPALGLVGSGTASALAMTGMALALGLYVHLARPTRHYRVLRDLRRPDPVALKALFRLGWPIGAAFGLEAGLFGAATLLVGRFGETALAAHQVAINAASITFMVPMGIGLATTVRVGQAAGRGDPAGAARAGYAGIALSVAFMTGTALFFWLRPEWVVWVYTGRDRAAPEVMALAAALLGVAAAFQLFDGTQVSASGALRGLKDTRGPMVISGVAYWGVGMGLALALGFGQGWGAVGVWWGLTAGLATAAVLLVARFRHRVRVGALAAELPAPAA